MAIVEKRDYKNDTIQRNILSESRTVERGI